MRSVLLVVVASLVAAASTSVSAAPGGAQIDWERGQVTATGIGLADRHAPNPVVARGPARRRAEDAARAALAKAMPELPLASGERLADALADPDVKARVDRAIADARAVATELETDGSWQVTLAVPVEAVRQAVTGPRALPAGGDAEGAPVVIVEGVTAAPAVGYTVGGLAAPTVWVDQVPAWAKRAPRVKSTGTKAGAIEAPLAKLAPSATDATLFVIVAKRR